MLPDPTLNLPGMSVLGGLSLLSALALDLVTLVLVETGGPMVDGGLPHHHLFSVLLLFPFGEVTFFFPFLFGANFRLKRPF